MDLEPARMDLLKVSSHFKGSLSLLLFGLKVFSQLGTFCFVLLLTINFCLGVMLWVSEKYMETFCAVIDNEKIKKIITHGHEIVIYEL